MMSDAPASRLVRIIEAKDPAERDEPIEIAVGSLSLDELLAECAALDAFRHKCGNLYARVRAQFFLYAIYRFFIPARLDGSTGSGATVSFEGHTHLLERRFGEAIDRFLADQMRDGISDAISSALAKAYYQSGLQNLADQVRSSVRAVRGNQWMFRNGCADDYPLRIRPQLLEKDDGMFPVIHESTAVRMDLSHSAWSDIFFLGMDFPEGARVLNISVDLAVHGRDPEPKPPVEAIFRVIDEPVIRLVSVDLGASVDITDLGDVFNFAKDYLGLLKAAIIAAGVVPIGMESSGEPLGKLLEVLLGKGRGFELTSCVNDIPKGSRLAVSTNLLGGLIAACMRATGQTRSITGPLEESERRIVAARAILGEWLGGSGGGWQDSGGVWPGIKVIEGCVCSEDDPEAGISRGRLLPCHTLLGTDEVSAEARAKLQASLVLVHGGMAQNVGPILEMVTEKYLLRSEQEWKGRAESIALFDEILAALKAGDMRLLGELTTRHFFGPLQTIIPWATTFFTEQVIERVQAEFGEDFWGFWMLGGMSGGGMGFIFDPARKAEALGRLREIMIEEKMRLQNSLPFAMEPVVYDFAINENGSTAELLRGAQALMPPGYYAQRFPSLLRLDPRTLGSSLRREMEAFTVAAAQSKRYAVSRDRLLENLFPEVEEDDSLALSLDGLLGENGFDPELHERIRADLQAGIIGLAKNRLAGTSRITDVVEGDVAILSALPDSGSLRAIGEAALANGEVAVVTLAAGAASRWTEGAGVVKALHPFCKFGGRHRSFLEVHLAKTRKTAQEFGGPMPLHAITTSYLTDGPISDYLEGANFYGMGGDVFLSRGRSIGLRLVPMLRDLRFEWEEMPQQVLDERAQKVRASLREALLDWAKDTGCGTDYRDNLPLQCLHPVGHWYEVPNLLLNGTLRAMLNARPQLRTLMLHNIDTVGAGLDPMVLGFHRQSDACLTFEVIQRRIEDRGGGLARVNGALRLVEGLAMPREDDEFKLTYYNSNTCWIDIDQLLALFSLTRNDLGDLRKIAESVREFSLRLPTYVTLKEVKKRWGHGQEDVFPVAQFEKLWGDMTALPELACSYTEVSRLRGQQLKEQAQLDAWLRDGSRDHVEELCTW
ncbi:MAG: UTP--glucose-1-phosphate uridylyltransferase [Verrucomicrobiales bacterium]